MFFFGGSTTWGFANRDSTTRPALVARRLAGLGYDPEVTNFAQQGWVSMQGFLTLVQELRAGNVPDVVIFWDGENDVPSAWRNGRPGLPYREPEREEDYAFASSKRRNGGAVDTRLAVRSLLMHSQLFRPGAAVRRSAASRTARTRLFSPLPRSSWGLAPEVTFIEKPRPSMASCR